MMATLGGDMEAEDDSVGNLKDERVPAGISTQDLNHQHSSSANSTLKHTLFLRFQAKTLLNTIKHFTLNQFGT